MGDTFINSFNKEIKNSPAKEVASEEQDEVFEPIILENHPFNQADKSKKQSKGKSSFNFGSGGASVDLANKQSKDWNPAFFEIEKACKQVKDIIRNNPHLQGNLRAKRTAISQFRRIVFELDEELSEEAGAALNQPTRNFKKEFDANNEASFTAVPLIHQKGTC